MSEIRGEKISFGKDDFTPLHTMPSSRDPDSLLVHCPPSRSRTRRLARAMFLLVCLCVLACGSVIFAIESGSLDQTLTGRAELALNDAIAPRYSAVVGSTVVRFNASYRLALEARDVDIVDQASGRHLSRVEALRLAVDPMALLGGRIAINSIEVEKIDLDTALLPASDPLDMAKLRIDALPQALETVFSRLDDLRGFIDRSGTESLLVSGFAVKFPAKDGGTPLSLVVDDLSMAHGDDGLLQLIGNVSINGDPARLQVTAQNVDGKAASLKADLQGLTLTPFLLKRMPDGAPREGLDTVGDVAISATRQDGAVPAAIAANIKGRPGFVHFDGVAQELSGADLNLAYDFDKNSIEIRRSNITLGPTQLPLSGALIDLDRLDPNLAAPGFGISLLVSGGVAQSAGSGVPPVAFDAVANGRYLAASRELQLDDMKVHSPLGEMAGSLKMRFSDKPPELSFGAQMPRMETAAVKQLWPYWIARKPRDWVMANLIGGTVTNGSISVFIPAGRMLGPGVPLELNENELAIDFDIADTRVNVTGDIPPLRDAYAHFNLRGKRLVVAVSSAGSFFPSGRSVKVDGGEFVLPATYDKPLMAELKISVSGAADAVAELADFRPIHALKEVGYKPEDFKGQVKADLQARFGIILDQNPPAPTYAAKIQLSNVDLGRPVDGRKVSDITGSLDIDPQAAHLDAKGSFDGVPATITLTEPVGKASTVERARLIKATLSNQQRELLAPGLSSILDGPMQVEMSRIDDTHQAVKVDLGKARISLPWVGWSKGIGIGAKSAFELSTEGGTTNIRNFNIDGDGFGAAGSLVLGKDGLQSASLSRVQLSPVDNYALSVKLARGVYDISVSGSKADVRPLIARLRNTQQSGAAATGASDAPGGATVRAKLEQISGFNDEAFRNVNALFAIRGDKISEAEFSGITGSGQAIVSQLLKGGGRDTISVTSGDAGAVARFGDIYNNMRGGLLNLKLNAPDGNNWSGSVDIRKFALSNEKRLQSLVATPVGEDGRSLNTAVKRDIDVSSETFQRGFARVVYRDGAMLIENGVVRGEQVGATFQGMLRDVEGNMDMTGTFMPAYGLNRLFAELPIIGMFLGNGSDRGLLGITFKMTGKFEQPRLQINPLSLIAPGIFRQIFEFQ
jgi:hypothetical protein